MIAYYQLNYEAQLNIFLDKRNWGLCVADHLPPQMQHAVHVPPTNLHSLKIHEQGRHWTCTEQKAPRPLGEAALRGTLGTCGIKAIHVTPIAFSIEVLPRY